MKRDTRGEAGFALIVAILALMLLTFLGLTLAMTTSTELQIATNYRWGQQALYNAEAGLEVARAIMIRVGDGQLLLPEARPGSWDPSQVTVPGPSPIPRFNAARNFEGSACDKWGNGAGYGQVFTDPNNAANPYENAHSAFGQNLNGGFTVWIRRELVLAGSTYSDNPVGENVTITSEGSAPFRGVTGAGDVGAFQRANQAVRRLEATVRITEGCKPGKLEDRDTGFFSCDS